MNQFSRPFGRTLWRVALALGMTLGSFSPGNAAPPPINIPAMAGENQEESTGVFGFLDGIERSSALLGDMWGLRTYLSRYGITLAIQETSEELGNVTGGTGRGFVYDGLSQVVGQLDTQRAFGFYGGLANVSFLNLHGGNLSANNLQTLQTASGIEADQATRLWELWYDQKFLIEDRLDLKVGQQSLDQEFMVSTNALYFVNTMFGWPMLPSADMPSGGPAYPLSALGARISTRPVNGIQILAGVFNGNPVQNDNGTDPQHQDRHGTNFPLNGGRLYIGEVQYLYPALGRMVAPGQTSDLGWTYKIGAWYNTNAFSDVRIDSTGLSLANPASSGIPQQHRGDYAVYGVADQLIWRDDQYPDRAIAVFVRAMGTPWEDRNPIDRSFNAGVIMHSPFRNRPADTAGVGMEYAHVSPQASQLDIDTAQFSGTAQPIRSGETVLETFYQYQFKPWILVQPDIQYVFKPGAGIPLPSNPSMRMQDELVMGLRLIISL